MYSKKSKTIFTLLMTLIGALLGFLYYTFWGCQSGCVIKSNPYTTTIYVSIMFAIISTLFWRNKKE